MSTEIWQSISADAKDLLKNMLSVDPECRPSIDDVLEHPWIENVSVCLLIVICIITILQSVILLLVIFLIKYRTH